MNTPQIKPWYKEFWFWFIISPILVVLVVSSITVTLAISGADAPAEGYYREEARMYYEVPQADVELHENKKQSVKVKPIPTE